MSLKAVDKLLDISLQKEPSYSRLDRLESDVWRQIRQSKAVSTISFMMPVWDNTRLRYASLMLAMIGGLMVSQVTVQPSKRADTLGLEIFSPNAPFLMTATFEQPEPASS